MEPRAGWAEVDRHHHGATRSPGSGSHFQTLGRVTEQDDRDVSYTTLRCSAQTELGFGGRSPTVRIDDPPAGEEAHLDFGLMGYVSGEGGKQRKLHVLIVTLPTSRYQFVWPTFLQTTEALIDGLDAAWAFFGGVPHRGGLDNMTAAIARECERPGDQSVVRRVRAGASLLRRPRSRTSSARQGSCCKPSPVSA